MGFVTHNVVSKAAAGDDGTGIAVALIRMGRGRSVARLQVTLRPRVVEALGWAEDEKIAVLLGADEDHGLIRLRAAPDGTAELKRVMAGSLGRGGPYFRIGLGQISQFVDRAEPKRWVAWERLEGDDAGWIEIVLPRWADETGPGGLARKRLSVGPAAVATAPRPSGSALTAAMMGDPPPERSALAGPTRGEARRQAEAREARRQAEAREAPQHAAAERQQAERAAMSSDRLGAVMQTFGLSKTEARYLIELTGGRTLTREHLLTTCHEEDEVELKSVDVYVHKLRKKLTPYLVEIETVRALGYQMPGSSIDRVTRMVDQFAARAVA